MNINFDIGIDCEIHIHTHNESAQITVVDQRILDGILTRFGALVRRLKEVDALTPPKELKK